MFGFYTESTYYTSSVVELGTYLPVKKSSHVTSTTALFIKNSNILQVERTRKWADQQDSSDSEDDRPREKVQSHFDKRFQQLNDKVKETRNHMKIDDWSSLIQDYEDLKKVYSNLKKQQGVAKDPPRNLVRIT